MGASLVMLFAGLKHFGVSTHETGFARPVADMSGRLGIRTGAIEQKSHHKEQLYEVWYE